MFELICLTVFVFVALWFVRRLVFSGIVASTLWLASKLKRPNPNATWQDAYAPRCTSCGYDLRASPNHCPECGEPVPAYERTIIHYLIKIGDGPPHSSS